MRTRAKSSFFEPLAASSGFAKPQAANSSRRTLSFKLQSASRPGCRDAVGGSVAPRPSLGPRRQAMRRTPRLWLAALFLALPRASAVAQTPPPNAAAPATGVAATVNGQPISEAAVQRGLERVPPARRAEKRAEVLNVLIDNALVDQYLLQLQVAADPKEVEKRVAEMKAELAKQKKDF